MIGDAERESNSNPDRINNSPMVNRILQSVTVPNGTQVFDALNWQDDRISLSELIKDVNISSMKHVPGNLILSLVSNYARLQLVETTGDGLDYSYTLTDLGKKVHAIIAAASDQIFNELRTEAFRRLNDASEKDS